MERVEHSSLRRERIQYGHERTKHLAPYSIQKLIPHRCFSTAPRFGIVSHHISRSGS